jgi:hypothetical protein
MAGLVVHIDLSYFVVSVPLQTMQSPADHDSLRLRSEETAIHDPLKVCHNGLLLIIKLLFCKLRIVLVKFKIYMYGVSEVEPTSVIRCEMEGIVLTWTRQTELSLLC